MFVQALVIYTTFSLALAAPQPVHAGLQARAYSQVSVELVRELNATGRLINALYAIDGSNPTIVNEVIVKNEVLDTCRNVTSAADNSGSFSTADSTKLKDRVNALDGYFQSVVDLYKYKRDVIDSRNLRSVFRDQLVQLRQTCYITQATSVVGKTATASKAAVSSIYAKTRARLTDGIAYYS